MTREEAIRRIKAWNLDSDDMEVLAVVIPELRESEDEKTRKDIIQFFKDVANSKTRVVCSNTFAEWATYLEKQKEHSMSAEEVLIKAGLKPYKDGNQWCILAGDNIQEGICGFGDTIDEALYQFLIEVLEMQKEQKPVEFTHHETNESLKDAVTHQMEDDGDIDDFVRKGIDDVVLKYAKLGAKWQKEQKPIAESERLANEVIEYLTKCGYSPVLKDDSKKEHFHIDIPRHEDDFWLSEEYKHCRSVLGKYYMEGDHGGDTYTLYVWREMEEQKPAEKQDYSGLNDLERAILRGFLAAGVENVPVGIIKDTAQECLAQMEPAEWSEEDKHAIENCEYAIKETFKDEQNPHRIETLNWLKYLPERFNLQPKQEWSDEDRTILKIITSDVARMMHKCGVGTDEAIIRSKAIRWLEALCPNQKSKWSEEDNKNLGEILGVIYEASCGIYRPFERDTYKRWESWLKSLRPQPHTVSIKDATKFGNLEYERGVKDGIQSEKSHQWKPSEEQMSMLLAVINEPNNAGSESCHIALKSLYNDLMKRM